MPAAILLLTAIWSLRLGEPETPLAVPIDLISRADVPQDALEALRLELGQLYSPAGVRFEWDRADTVALVSVVLEARPSHPIITGCRRNLHDHRLGLTSLRNRRVILWSEQVARGTAGDWDSRQVAALSDAVLGRALGRVLAHELGHLFLGLTGHRSKGLMKASFQHHQLMSLSRKGLTFSREDAAVIREAVRSLLGKTAAAAER